MIAPIKGGTEVQWLVLSPHSKMGLGSNLLADCVESKDM